MMQQNSLLESYLRQLKLPTFAQNYAAIASDAARTDLSCERYLLALCEAELAQRDANRVERCIAQAKLPVLKELSQFDWNCVQGVSKTRVFELAQGGYIAHAEPILMIGNPGLGKTHVAAALALAACRQGRRVHFHNVATLVNDLIVAQHELKLSRFMAALGDRLTHRAHILEFLGESFRFRQRLQQAERQGQQLEVADPAVASPVPAPSSG